MTKFHFHIAQDEGYRDNILLISPRKHMFSQRNRTRSFFLVEKKREYGIRVITKNTLTCWILNEELLCLGVVIQEDLNVSRRVQ